MSAEMVHCYHKGCGKLFDPNKNDNADCIHHPGEPYFHDGYKEWTCCKKKSRDFTVFLSMEGCVNGSHSNEKPVEVEKPENDSTRLLQQEVITVDALKPPVRLERPSSDERLVSLKQILTSSLKTTLSSKLAQLSVKKTEDSDDTNAVKVGTPCMNKGCQKLFKDDSSYVEDCIHHPGEPIFHEGMKYWSCCQMKTSDFDKFLEQLGCVQGKHVWKKKEDDDKKKAHCRLDWFQTGSHVTISVFAKATVPENSIVEANKVCVKVNLVFEGGECLFHKIFNLAGIIDPDTSSVKLLGSKVEINLKKAEPFSWPDLQLPNS